ncbi:MAG TPA: hypothetical protein DIU35_14235 [Candidatus Latescibacteria bacterium]|nr:hypothetical protein [Gemmatimonadota bacterium]HCR18633.1 hypothetical protein [Candidatus Latescibacterota bacterium]|tara:strand:- start:3915 stop:4199 length:285 start_codon:yes stop_codon:yes gene_type:complete
MEARALICDEGQNVSVKDVVLRGPASDQIAIRAFAAAMESLHKPGVSIKNASVPKAWVADPFGEILRNWWGDDVDTSHLDQWVTNLPVSTMSAG